jgi:hypothetical protein
VDTLHQNSLVLFNRLPLNAGAFNAFKEEWGHILALLKYGLINCPKKMPISI